MKAILKSQTITNGVLFVLLVTRISISVLALIGINFLDKGLAPSLNWIKSISPWLNGIYMTGAVVLIAIVILINQDHLLDLNIDKLFVFIFLYSGLAIFLEYFWGFGCLSGIATILFIIYALSNKNLKFNNPNPTVWMISFIVVGVFIISIIAISNFLNTQKIEQNIYLFFLETIPSSVYEEVIYRGMLWMFLKNLKWTEIKIFFATACLFWISHLNYILSNPFNFWVFIPLVRLLLGYMVVRSRSITPSTVAHVLINLLYGLVIVS